MRNDVKVDELLEFIVNKRIEIGSSNSDISYGIKHVLDELELLILKPSGDRHEQVILESTDTLDDLTFGID